MNINFNKIMNAYGSNNTSLSKIYGQGDTLLWQRGRWIFTKQTVPFIFVNDKINLVTTRRTTSSPYTEYEGKGINGNFYVPHTQYNGSSFQPEIGNNWYGAEGRDNYFSRTLDGLNTTRTYYIAAVMKMVKILGMTGIYLYVPMFDLLVEKDSPYEDWNYTDDATNAFDITPYLSDDPFSDENWNELETEYKITVQSTEVTLLLSETFKYKRFCHFMRTTTGVFIDPKIDNFFGKDWDSGNYEDNKYMLYYPYVYPERINSIDNSEVSKHIGILYHQGTSTYYKCILPTNEEGWKYTYN